MKKAVCYYRVSTRRQGKSGLGLEAQQKAVADHVRHSQVEIIHECIEIESGRNRKRPVLKAAIKQCKKNGAILLIAKLDRLGRNVAFVSALMESNIDFVAVDMPFASKLVLHIMAAFAEHEADQIRRRTKEALQAAKARGVQLGKNGRDVLSKRNRESARAFAKQMEGVISEMRNEGIRSIRKITETLNLRKIPTYRGVNARWHVNTVSNLLHRIEQTKNSEI